MEFYYDIIIPTSSQDISFVSKVCKYIRKNIAFVDIIYIITNKKNFNKIRVDDRNNLKIVLLDENQLVKGLNYNVVMDLISSKNIYHRVGWYFQQFLKMGFATSEYCNKFYLSWDADTIPLSPLRFFKNSYPVFTKKYEYNELYFNTLKKLLNIEKTADFSFIAEHMLFSKDIMLEIINRIQSSTISGNSWFEKILNACDSLDKPCFSEFETYGTYVWNYYPDMYVTQRLNTFRSAGLIKGRWIDDKTLNKISFDLDTASFELFDKPPFPYSIPYYVYVFKRRWYQIKNRPINNLVSFLKDKICEKYKLRS